MRKVFLAPAVYEIAEINFKNLFKNSFNVLSQKSNSHICCSLEKILKYSDKQKYCLSLRIVPFCILTIPLEKCLFFYSQTVYIYFFPLSTFLKKKKNGYKNCGSSRCSSSYSFKTLVHSNMMLALCQALC